MESDFKTQVLWRAAIPTGLLAVLLVAVTWGMVPGHELVVGVPVFCVLYGALFTVGQEGIATRLRGWIGTSAGRAFLLPAAMIALLYGYCAVGGGNPVQGTGLILPSLLLFPVFLCHQAREMGRPIEGRDIACVALFLVPLSAFRLPVEAGIPYSGGGFDSAVRVVILVIAVYAFVVVRGVTEVGAVVTPQWRPLVATVGIWFAFFALCFVVATATGFLAQVARGAPTVEGIRDGVRQFLKILLHTALFEELFFRGLLQNMAAQRIARAGDWRPAWRGGLAVLLPLAVVAGVTLRGAHPWLPPAACGIVFGAAYLLERRGGERLGAYTALAVVGSAFGLVHYHAGSQVFITLAIIAGWAYGYAYLRTRNLIYPVLIHTLINSSPILVGLALVK
ncbi:MAG: CPBP family intramembrane metalloprotease [Nitrospirota bacterium]|jgi:hypothetical protein